MSTYTYVAPTASTKTTSHIVVITTTSSAASVMNHTVTSALTATSVHPISSSLGIDIHIQYKLIYLESSLTTVAPLSIKLHAFS